MTTPVVFVETNFFVFLLFPHDDHRTHEDARTLLRDNHNGYRLEMPSYSMFESRGTVKRKKQELLNEILKHETTIRNLYKRHLISDTPDSVIQELHRYAGTDFEQSLNDLLTQLAIIDLDEDVLRILREEVYPLKIFQGKDVMDAHILASILKRCRELPADTPRIFMSTNIKQFGQIPQDVLDAHRLVYSKSFNYTSSLHLWKQKYH